VSLARILYKQNAWVGTVARRSSWLMLSGTSWAATQGEVGDKQIPQCLQMGECASTHMVAAGICVYLSTVEHRGRQNGD